MKCFKIISFFVLLVSFYSCKKNQIGGKATIKGVVMHHSKPIANAIIYIKYNATEFPGSNVSLYDSYINADNSGSFSVSIFKGSYYLYAIGNDLDIALPNDVKGGLSFSIRNNEHLVKNIAVTE
jgi:hypothetical protein